MATFNPQKSIRADSLSPQLHRVPVLFPSPASSYKPSSTSSSAPRFPRRILPPGSTWAIFQELSRWIQPIFSPFHLPRGQHHPALPGTSQPVPFWPAKQRQSRARAGNAPAFGSTHQAVSQVPRIYSCGHKDLCQQSKHGFTPPAQFLAAFKDF